MPCQVPSSKRPSAKGTLSDTPVSSERAWAAMWPQLGAPFGFILANGFFLLLTVVQTKRFHALQDRVQLVLAGLHQDALSDQLLTLGQVTHPTAQHREQGDVADIHGKHGE